MKDYQLPGDIECDFVKINIKTRKWLLADMYVLLLNLKDIFVQKFGKTLHHFSTKLKDFILMAYFSTDEKGQNISNVMESCSLIDIVKAPTYFKSDRPKTINMILTKRTSKCQNTTSIEKGLSDFHCMVSTVKEWCFQKGP